MLLLKEYLIKMSSPWGSFFFLREVRESLPTPTTRHGSIKNELACALGLAVRLVQQGTYINTHGTYDVHKMLLAVHTGHRPSFVSSTL